MRSYLGRVFSLTSRGYLVEVTIGGRPARFGPMNIVKHGTTIDPPVLDLAETKASGGTFASGTYYWKVTAQNEWGETTASNEVSALLPVNGTQALAWDRVRGATSYRVYRGGDAGEGMKLVGEGVGLGFIDTGLPGGLATPPLFNTTEEQVEYRVGDQVMICQVGTIRDNFIIVGKVVDVTMQTLRDPDLGGSL